MGRNFFLLFLFSAKKFRPVRFNRKYELETAFDGFKGPSALRFFRQFYRFCNVRIFFNIFTKTLKSPFFI